MFIVLFAQFSTLEVSATVRALLPLPGSTWSQTNISLRVDWSDETVIFKVELIFDVSLEM